MSTNVDPEPTAWFVADKIVEWGLYWHLEPETERVLIAPVTAITDDSAPSGDTFKLPTNNLEVLEIAKFDDRYIVLVISEYVASVNLSRTYALIVMKDALMPKLTDSVKDHGFVIPKIHLPVHRILQCWTELKANRDKYNRDRKTKVPPSPLKKKRGSSLRVVDEPPAKKPSQRKKSDPKVEEMTLAKVVNMTSKTVAGKSAKELQQVRALYEKEFTKLHIFGKRPIKKSERSQDDLLVDIDKLHRAPAGSIVYRNLELKRVNQLMDQKRAMPFQPSLQHLYVMPVKGEPPIRKEDFKDVPTETYEYFDHKPTWSDINERTHFIIIGGQHCVAAHRALIAEGGLSEEDRRDARSFIVTVVWAKKEEWNLLIYYSRVLNQDLAGVRSEGNYLTLLGLARRSWREAGSPAPSLTGLAHSHAFKVCQHCITVLLMIPRC